MNGVWAIDENGKPAFCKAKPENRGKRKCKHKFHAEDGQSMEQFFAEHSVRLDNIFKSETVELKLYRMTELEKEELVKITDPKQLKNNEGCPEGGYMTFPDPLWNDMDKNYFSEKYDFDKSDLNAVLHNEKYILLVDFEGHKAGELFSKEEADLMDEKGAIIDTGFHAMNDYAGQLGFEATRDVYVLPYYMRQGVVGADGEVIPSDETKLYNSLLRMRGPYEDQAQFKYEQLINSSDAYKKNNGGIGKRPLRSLDELFKGKSGVWRKNITGYTIPYAGRAVAIPSTEYNYDEAGIPASMAIDIFKPSITKNLSDYGFTSEQISELYRDAKRNQNEVSPTTKRLLNRALEETNVRIILDRQPTLHSASMQSFKPKISDNACVNVNPIIVNGYNLDFDGDTMQVIGINSSHIVDKVDKELHPSNFKFSPRNQSDLIMKPTKDAKWGIMNILKKRSQSANK